MKRIFSILLAFIISFNLSFASRVTPVTVKADAITYSTGNYIVQFVMSFLFTAYGIVVVGEDVGHYVDVPDVPSDAADLPGVTLPDDVGQDVFDGSWSVTESDIEWAIAGEWLTMYGGQKPDPNQDPRNHDLWLKIVSAVSIVQNWNEANLFDKMAGAVPAPTAEDSAWASLYKDKAAACTSAMLTHWREGYPETWWGYGDNANSVGMMSNYMTYTFDTSVSGVYDMTFETQNQTGFMMEHPLFSDLMNDWKNSDIYDGSNIYDKGFFTSEKGTSNGFQNNTFHFFEEGTVLNVTSHGYEVDISPTDYTYYIDAHLDGETWFFEQKQIGTVAGVWHLNSKDGQVLMYSNMLFNPTTQQLRVPSTLGILTDLSWQMQFNPFINNVIDNGYVPNPDNGTVYDENTGDTGNDWSEYDVLTKDDIYEILKDPEIYKNFKNTTDFQDPNSGKIVQNTNDISNDTSDISQDTSSILKTLKSIGSTISSLPKKIADAFGNLFSGIVDILSDIFTTLSNFWNDFTDFVSELFANLGNILGSITEGFSNVVDAINNLSFDDIAAAISSIPSITELPGAIASGLESVFIPSGDSLMALKSDAGTFFDKYFGMPVGLFDALMVEGKDVPDVKIKLAGKTYTAICFCWFNSFVEDFRAHIQMVFVIIWLFWLANQLLSLFDKSGVINGHLDDLNSGSRSRKGH